MSKIIKDPLTHFLILGVILFVVVSQLGGNKNQQYQISITTTTQKHLADLFEITWQRKPSAEELYNLTKEHIKEEIYYREALALGLDENDTIVRRRLRQKLEFMQEDLESLQPPTEAELMGFFETHKQKYMTDTIVSFQQIMLAPQRLTKDEVESIDAIEQLNAGIALQRLSRSSLLPVSMKLETEKSVISTFGQDFMAQIKTLQTGTWFGPVYSSFGTHLVNISLQQPAKRLSFAQVRGKVSVDYIQFQRERAAKRYYENLKGQYHISIEDAP